jgi:hypothetical protein
VRTATIVMAVMIEAVRTSETSVYLNETTRRSIPESYHLQDTFSSLSSPFLISKLHLNESVS